MYYSTTQRHKSKELVYKNEHEQENLAHSCHYNESITKELTANQPSTAPNLYQRNQ